jgi:hypothetical protein
VWDHRVEANCYACARRESQADALTRCDAGVSAKAPAQLGAAESEGERHELAKRPADGSWKTHDASLKLGNTQRRFAEIEQVVDGYRTF